MRNEPEHAGDPSPGPFDKLATSESAKLRKADTKLIQIVNAALADATLRSGEHLVCHPGCTPCCHGAFAINPLDALRLRSAMTDLADTDSELAARIEARAHAYLLQFAPGFPGNPVTGILDTSSEAEDAFDEFANEAACPALNPGSGLCDLYEARPMTCRVFGPPVRIEAGPGDGDAPAFGLCELCFTAASEEEITAAEMTVPHDLEREILEQEILEHIDQGDTLVAYCLTPFRTASSTPQ